MLEKIILVTEILETNIMNIEIDGVYTHKIVSLIVPEEEK